MRDDEWVNIDDCYRDQYTRGSADKRSTYTVYLEAEGFKPDGDDVRFSRAFPTDLPEDHSKPAFLADMAIRFIHEN